MSLVSNLKNPNAFVAAVLGVVAFSVPVLSSAEGPSLKVGGAGWMQYGTIVKSSDTAQSNDLEGRGLLASGAQISLSMEPLENLRVEAGLGVAAGHQMAANSLRQGGYAPIEAGPYVSNANFNYSFWNSEAANLSIKGGLFDYNYNPEVQNLGLYLLRGPVYPGYVLSGFETKNVLPVANMIGFQVHHQTGGFQHDLLVSVETEFYPFWDFSPAYLASYNFGKTFRIGGGVNFYHLIPVDSRLTSDTTKVYIDTVPLVDDTTQISFAGTKVMMNMSFDIKGLLGSSDIFGPEDLKIYGEVALIGLDNSPAYKAVYGSYANRMPMMVGFNLPTFKMLNRLSLEVESYSAKFKDDLTGFNYYGTFSPIPIGKLDSNYAADNIKWSLHGSKMIQNHVKISLQVASDHFRPGIFKGYGDNNPPSRQAVLFKPSDWYWMSKIAYFF